MVGHNSGRSFGVSRIPTGRTVRRTSVQLTVTVDVKSIITFTPFQMSVRQ